MDHGYELRQFCGGDMRVQDRYYQPHERDWEGGIDNDGLDISQLESYINDDNNETMYFGDLQGGVTDLKTLQGNTTPRDSPSRLHHHHHHHHHHHQPPSLHHHPHQPNYPQPPPPPHQLAVVADQGGGGPGGTVHLTERGHSHLGGHLTEEQRGQHLTEGVQLEERGGSVPIIYPNQYQHQDYPGYAGYRHHLPDSPPDSGSEPYSPPDHPSLSPQQKVGGLTDLYTRPPGGGGGGGGGSNVMAFPYTVLGGTQPLPPQQTPQPLQPTLYQPQQNIMLGGASPLNSTPTVVGVVSGVYGGQGGSGLGDGGVGLSAGKKRKIDGTGRTGSMQIKQEPEVVGSTSGGSVSVVYGDDDDYTTDSTNNGPFLDGSYQCIRFQHFQQHTWSILCDAELKELPMPTFRVDADKGFNFSNPDEAFVCQKKNHFQVTVQVQATGDPVFVKSPDGLQKVDRFLVHFFGVKTESPSQMIRVEQSQSDRSKKAFHPVVVDLRSEQPSKMTVGRLHFSETTSNNMRKKGKPNPDQRYFYLVVGLKAHCGDNAYLIVGHASEKIIVRASNPGQFESDVEYTFQRGSYPESIYHMGRVGINTDRPDEALVIHGNLKITGQLMQPSDKRAKKDVAELDTREQLKNVQNLRVVKYAYREEYAEQAGMEGDAVYDTGVIAQEVKEVIPDAVKTTGGVTLSNGEKIENFLMVNKERIFMENVGAVKELCKVTGNLENRIDELETMNKKISQLRRYESFKSTTSSVSTRTSGTATSRVSSMCHRSRGCSKRRKHLGSSQHDEGVCSNKTLQVTTITLVCIMAFCLMAMATIYILDYYERRRDNSDSTLLSTATTIVLSSSMTTPAAIIPSSTMRAITTSDDETLNSSFFTTKPFLPTTVGPILPHPPPLGKPENCPDTDPSEDPVCHEFCCSSVTMQGVVIEPYMSRTTPTTAITITRRIFPLGPTTVPPTMSRYGEVITNRLSTSDPNIVNDSTTQVIYKPMPLKKSGNYDQMVRLARHQARMNRPSSSRSIKQTLSKRSIRSKRSTSNRPQYRDPLSMSAQIPTIEIMELNTTVNHLYCLNGSDSYQECLANMAKNYTYGLPISRFMPHNNLTLHFRYMTESFTRPVVFCAMSNDTASTYPPQQCTLTNEVISPNDVGVTVGETSQHYYGNLANVGLWLKVAYKFRISIIDAEENPCNFEPETIGEKFYEFNFLFQRICF